MKSKKIQSHGSLGILGQRWITTGQRGQLLARPQETSRFTICQLVCANQIENELETMHQLELVY